MNIKVVVVDNYHYHVDCYKVDHDDANDHIIEANVDEGDVCVDCGRSLSMALNTEEDDALEEDMSSEGRDNECWDDNDDDGDIHDPLRDPETDP